MNASDPMTPAMRPYLPATADFAAGGDSPRRFLERCLAALDAWEPKIGAFVTLNLAAAREAFSLLPERERRVFRLCWEGYTLSEVAQRTGLTPKAARHLRDRAVAHLRARMEGR